MAHLPARAAPLHARPREPAARLVPRTRDRGPAVAREAPSRRHVHGRRHRGLPVLAPSVGDRRLRLARPGKVGTQGVLRHLEPQTRLRRRAPARPAEDCRAGPAGQEGRIPAWLPRHRGRRCEPADLLRARRRPRPTRRNGRSTGHRAGRTDGQHERGHHPDRCLERGQGGASPGRVDRTSIPGSDRHPLLRYHALQGLPVTRAPDALRGGTRLRDAAGDRQQRPLLGPDREDRIPGTTACL